MGTIDIKMRKEHQLLYVDVTDGFGDYHEFAFGYEHNPLYFGVIKDNKNVFISNYLENIYDNFPPIYPLIGKRGLMPPIKGLVLLHPKNYLAAYTENLDVDQVNRFVISDTSSNFKTCSQVLEKSRIYRSFCFQVADHIELRIDYIIGSLELDVKNLCLYDTEEEEEVKRLYPIS